jgi:hypothetical protein
MVKEIKITLFSENEGDLMELAQLQDAEQEPVQLVFDGKVAMASFCDDAEGDDGTYESMIAEILDNDKNVEKYVIFSN